MWYEILVLVVYHYHKRRVASSTVSTQELPATVAEDINHEKRQQKRQVLQQEYNTNSTTYRFIGSLNKIFTRLCSSSSQLWYLRFNFSNYVILLAEYWKEILAFVPCSSSLEAVSNLKEEVSLLTDSCHMWDGPLYLLLWYCLFVIVFHVIISSIVVSLPSLSALLHYFFL